MFLNIKKKILISIATSLISLILVIFFWNFPKHFVSIKYLIKTNTDENFKTAFCQEINFTYILLENFLETFKEKYGITKYDIFVNREYEIKIQLDSQEYISDKIIFDMEKYFETNTAKEFLETFKKNINYEKVLTTEHKSDDNSVGKVLTTKPKSDDNSWGKFLKEFKSSEFCKFPIKHFSTLRNNYKYDKKIYIFTLLCSVFVFTFVTLTLINQKNK